MESYTCTEYINVDNLNKMLRAKKVDEDTLKVLASIKRHAKNGSHRVEFVVKDKKSRSNAVGRMYPKNSHPCLQGLKRDVRKALAYDSCMDLDIKNAHPVILSQILKQNDIPCEKLDYYVNNREVVLELYDDRDYGKERMTSLINNGRPKKDCPQFESEFYHDVMEATSKLFKLAKYEIYYKKGEVEKPSNAHGHAVSFLCQDYERKCITAVIEKLRELDYEPSTIIHDGLLIHTREVLDEHIKEIEEHVLSQTRIKVDLVVKPMNIFNEDNLWETDTPTNGDEKCITHILIDKMLDWAYENKLYRNEDYGVLQSTEVSYWAEPKWTEPKHVINAWLREAGDDTEFMFKSSLIKNNQALTKFITDIDDKKFPFVKFNKDYFGYRDGVYDIVNNRFFVPEDKVFCRNYFDIPFDSVCSPSLLQVLQYQDLDHDTIQNIWGLLGRMFFEVNQLDKFQLFPIFDGVAGSGKSRLAQFVSDSLRPGACGTISSTSSKGFVLQGKDTKEALVISDGSNKLCDTIPEDVMKSMPVGEPVDINAKGISQKSVPWKVPFMACCNEGLGYRGSAFERRFVVIPFTKPVEKENQDFNLVDKLKIETPHMIPFVVNEYHKLLQTKKPFWEICSQFIKDTSENNLVNLEPIRMFLNEGSDTRYDWCEYREGSVVPLRDFKQSYSNFCKFNLRQDFKWNNTTDTAILNSMGFVCRNENVCKSCGNTHKKDCCSNYQRNNRTKKSCIVNMVLHTRKMDYSADL